MSIIGEVSVFDHNTQEWEVYYGRFKQFLKLNETVIKEDTSKCALLLSNLADDTYRLTRNLLHPKDLDKVTFGELTTALDGHFKPKQCTFADRAKFYDARRSPGESVDDWAARLRGLAIRCEFGTALDQLITDRFVLGMSAGHERERLFEEDAVKLKFSKALKWRRRRLCSPGAGAAACDSEAGASIPGAKPVRSPSSWP
ncbi:hypothetical protein NE865_08407 [Phthorimaea operculella]|nr:hypothetical protein NE865_08407 [Phthorimaea operculella]